MTPAELLAGLATGPDHLLQDFDWVNRRGLIVRLDEDSLRRASFLDHRALKPGTTGAWFALPLLLEQGSKLRTALPAHYLFHLSHCGSTLISRLLAELGSLPLREPLTLVHLALERRELERPTARLDAATWERLLAFDHALFSRGYRAGERSIVKATSVACNLIAPLLQHSSSSRALLVYTDFESWLANMLKNEPVRENGRAYSQAWLADFHALTGRKDIRLAGLNDVQQFTLNWLTGMLHFERARRESPERGQWLDFDAFLQDPATGLKAAADFLGLDTSHVAVAANSTLMRNYAKNPDKPFDRAKREQELTASRQANAEELRQGMQYAERLCSEVAALAPLGAYLSRSNSRKE